MTFEDWAIVNESGKRMACFSDMLFNSSDLVVSFCMKSCGSYRSMKNSKCLLGRAWRNIMGMVVRFTDPGNEN